MYRNLLASIETFVPIEPRDLRARLWEILSVMLNDQRSRWTLQSDGSYIQAKPHAQKEEGTHQQLMKIAVNHAQPSVLQTINHPVNHSANHIAPLASAHIIAELKK